MFPFGELADVWWNTDGPLAALHRLNKARMAIIRHAFGGAKGLSGKTVLDIGCGCGLAAESLARLGAHVVAIDTDARLIRAARTHAAQSGLSIAYRRMDIEDVAGTFDLVLLLEVLEHADDPALLIKQAASRLAPGGKIIIATVSRTFRSWALGIIMAEYLLGWIPKGTHDWRKFQRPSDIIPLLEAAGLVPEAPLGLVFMPEDGTWREDGENLSANWIVVAKRPEAKPR